MLYCRIYLNNEEYLSLEKDLNKMCEGVFKEHTYNSYGLVFKGKKIIKLLKYFKDNDIKYFNLGLA